MVDNDLDYNVHPDAEKLQSFGQGLLAPEEAATLEEHLAGCDECCRLLEATPNDSFVGQLRAAQALPITGTHRSLPSDAAYSDAEEMHHLSNHPRFSVAQILGRGGMGLVIRCRDSALNRDLAIKVLLKQFQEKPELVSRFMEEARITGQLQHPYIVPVHELGTLADGRPYFTMKLVQGRTLADLLRERLTPARDLSRFLVIFEQICQTIAYVHSKGVIHRDLKPANVMVGAFGEVQVMDWGLAKVLADDAPSAPVLERNCGAAGESPKVQTNSGMIMGTFAYMPPEQAHADPLRVSRRSDVFGLGAIVCEILTGLPPYTGEPSEVREKARSGQLDEALARLDGCGAESELILLAKRCLAGDPAERQADGTAVADAMAHYFGGVRERMQAAEIARATAETEATEEHKRVVLAEAKALSETKRRKAEVRRRRVTVLLGLSLVLLVAVGAGFAWWYRSDQTTREAEAAARRATTERDVTAALTEVRLRHEEGMKQADHPERWKQALVRAWDALKQAQISLNSGESTDELGEKVAKARALLEQDERDRNLFATLERLGREHDLSHRKFEGRRRLSLLFQAFKDYGLDLERLAPKEVAALLREHPHRGRLADEINILAQMQAASGEEQPRELMPHQGTFSGVAVEPRDWSKADKLSRVLNEIDADPHSFGTRWRAGRAVGDVKTLVKMAQSSEAKSLSSRAFTSVADDLITLEAIDEARTLLVEAHERNPSDYRINLYFGLAAMGCAVSNKGSSLDEALRYFTSALALRGNDVVTHLQLCNAFRAQGKIDEALRAANAAVRADPNSGAAHYYLGGLLFDNQDFDNALKAFGKAADLEPQHPGPCDALGAIYHARKEYDMAQRQYELAIKREPSYAIFYVHLGQVLAAKEDYDGAIQQYDEALKRFPEYAPAYNQKAIALSKKNDINGAIHCLQKARAADPKVSQNHYMLGRLLLTHRGDAKGAIQCFQAVIDQQPKAAHAHFQMAMLLQELNRLAECEARLREVIAIDPRYPDAQRRLGDALAFRKDWHGAIAAYRSAIDNDKESKNKAILHESLSLAFYTIRDFNKAIEHLRKVLELDPNNARCLCILGFLQMAEGNAEEAAATTRAAIKLSSKEPGFHNQLASIYLEMNELDKAIASARNALELDSTLAVSYHLIAVAQINRGECEAALETIRKGQSSAPMMDPVQEQLRADYQLGESFVKLEALLPAVLRGDEKSITPSDKYKLALVCGNKHRKYVAAYRLFVDAFAAEPALEELLDFARLRPAFFAVRAGTVEAEKGVKLDDAEKERMRNKALDWLNAELEDGKKRAQAVPAPEQGLIRFRIRQWLTEPALERVRKAEMLEQLPIAERQAWARFWAKVEAFAAAN